ncbi:MAG: aspartyl protease family protein [Chitinophagaceae bacterium]|nr:aspartyl protease family protein [Chitinophagaceae bacterium]
MPSIPRLISCIGIFLSFAFTIAGEKGNPGHAGDIRRNFTDSLSPFPSPHINFLNDPVIASDTPSCVIPFNRAGNLIVIKARVDTTEGNFILDTGAPGLILNMTYFRNYPSSSRADDESGGITGNVVTSSPTDVADFVLGTYKYSRVEADRINLGHIENSRGIRVLGLLGMNLFKRFEMIIDYENNLLYLHLISKKEAKTYQHEMLNDTKNYNEFPIDIKENKLYTYGEVAGKKLTFIVDTGAESNVLDSRLPDRILENLTINSRVLLSGTGNSKVEALSGDMKNIKMANLEISSLPVIVTNLEKMCRAYDDRCLDGMLGFDFLSLHKIGFNFVNRKMYIWK